MRALEARMHRAVCRRPVSIRGRSRGTAPVTDEERPVEPRRFCRRMPPAGEGPLDPHVIGGGKLTARAAGIGDPAGLDQQRVAFGVCARAVFDAPSDHEHFAGP